MSNQSQYSSDDEDDYSDISFDYEDDNEVISIVNNNRQNILTSSSSQENLTVYTQERIQLILKEKIGSLVMESIEEQDEEDDTASETPFNFDIIDDEIRCNRNIAEKENKLSSHGASFQLGLKNKFKKLSYRKSSLKKKKNCRFFSPKNTTDYLEQKQKFNKIQKINDYQKAQNIEKIYLFSKDTTCRNNTLEAINQLMKQCSSKSKEV